MLNTGMKSLVTFYFTLYDQVGNQEKAVEVRFWKAFQATQRKRLMSDKTL